VYARQKQLKGCKSDADIIYTNEVEIATADKILLLVNRMLNDKDSLPGYILRHLIETYNDRCRHRTIVCESDQSSIGTLPRIRRDDAHAIIKHLTAILMNLRSEFGSSTRFTDLTASSVEAVVFGQIYDSVLEEIIYETLHYDSELWRKITKLFNESPELLSLSRLEQEAFTNNNIERLSMNQFAPVSSSAVDTLKMVHQSRSVSDKLHFCVKFVDCLSLHHSKLYVNDDNNNALCADTLIQMVCQHIVIAENYGNLYAQIRFIEEFARDEQLINGYDGYALVTIQASLHVLQESADDFYLDLFRTNDE
jgi:Vacuolar sorting protein 9 (VPS9) domain